MTPREIAERHCNVVEGDGFYCLSVCGTLEPFATKADAEKARAGCLDELTAVIAAACEEAAAEARRAEREACAQMAENSAKNLQSAAFNRDMRKILLCDPSDGAKLALDALASNIRARKEAE